MEQYYRRAREVTLRVGDWILVHFPQDESGRWRKLSRPWHGPYRITEKIDPNITCVKVYHPQDGPICIHQSRICLCPDEFPAGYYWYGGKRRGPGRPPKWVDRLLQTGSSDATHFSSRSAITTATSPSSLGQHRDVAGTDSHHSGTTHGGHQQRDGPPSGVSPTVDNSATADLIADAVDSQDAPDPSPSVVDCQHTPDLCADTVDSPEAADLSPDTIDHGSDGSNLPPDTGDSNNGDQAHLTLCAMSTPDSAATDGDLAPDYLVQGGVAATQGPRRDSRLRRRVRPPERLM